MIATSQPPRQVLESFGAAGPPVALPRGQATAWRCGDLVLKPLDASEDTLRWHAELLTDLQAQAAFRVAPPVAARDGAMCVEGWTCWPYLVGQRAAGEWDAVLAAGDAFHVAVRDVPYPPLLDERADDWAVADRIAWGELPLGDHRLDPGIAALWARIEPVDEGPQLIHADLTGNVLLHPDLPPAVIDITPYWRPPMYASAVVLVDALMWHHASPDILRTFGQQATLPQHLLRAMIFRLVTDRRRLPARPPVGDRYQRAISTVCRWVDSR